MTRKIEQQMIAAARAGKAFKSGNTEVRPQPGTPGVAVYLHGNKIVEFTPAGWQWTLAGWNTATTRSRINALANAFGWPRRVYQKDGMPRVTGPDQTPITSTEWVQAF